MSMTALSHDAAANPLDIMEQIVIANDWAFDRRSDSEMAAEAPGRWCDYGLYFCWSHEISAMHFTCAFDLKVPEKRRAALYELLALANERLWIGHFGMESEDGMPVFRHAVLLRGAPGPRPRAWRTWWTSPSPNASGSSRLPVRAVGRQDAAGRAGGGDARVRRRGMSRIPPILLVGCGRMGSAMLAGWREQGLAASVAVDPAPSGRVPPART